MAFPDSNINVNNQGGTVTTGNGSNGVGTASGSAKATIQDIFNRKMTRAQVQNEFGQAGLDLFDKANTDGQDGISQDELNAYNNPQPKVEDLTSKSGKRTAPGGVYTVVSGDTLSKIAADFGVALIPLYDNNRDVIGNNINKIQVGMKIRIKEGGTSSNPASNDATASDGEKPAQQSGRTEAEKEELRNTLRQYAQQLRPSEQPCIFVGMTRAQAEKIGGKTLEVFNQYCKGADKISNSAFAEYQKTLMPQLTTENLSKMLNGIVGENFDKKDLKILVDEVLPTLMDMSGAKQSKKSDEISGDVQSLLLELTNDTSLSPGEKSKRFYEELKTRIEDDKNDENGAYNYHKNRLKNGEFTEFEKNYLGLTGDVELTEEQLEQYAQLAAKAEFILPVVTSLKDAVNRKDDKALMTLIMNVGKDFFGNADVQGILQMYGLSAIVNELNQRLVANEWAENGTLDLNETSDFVGKLYAASVIKNADEEHVQIFIENNADHLDMIQEAAKAVINNMEDGDKKTALENAINNAVSNVQNGTVGSDNSQRGAADKGAYSNNTYNTQGNGSNTAYVSAPNFDTQQSREVNDLKKAATAYQLQNQKPVEEQKELSYEEYKSLTQATALRVLKRLDPVTQATIIKNIVADNKGNSKEMVTIYDDTDCFALMTAIKNNFIQKGQGLQLDLLTNSNQLVQKFLIKEGVITNEDLAHLSNEDRSKLEEDGIISA